MRGIEAACGEELCDKEEAHAGQKLRGAGADGVRVKSRDWLQRPNRMEKKKAAAPADD